MTEPREGQAKIERQIELERSWVDEGIKEYQDLRKRRGEGHLPPGVKLTMKLMEPVVEGVEELCLGTNIQQKPVRDFLLNFRPEEVAFVTVQTCINAIASGGKKQRRTNLALQIADQLITKRNYDILISHAEAKHKAAVESGEGKANLARFIEREMSKLRQYYLKKRGIERLLAREGIKLVELPAVVQVQVGIHLMYIFKNRTGLVELQKHRIGDDSHQTYYITPTEELLEDLERQHERCAALNTMLRPMIVPPKPWTNTVDGGYYTILNKSTWLVRNRPPEGCQVGEAREMNQEPGTGIPEFIPADHAQEVYEAINTVQNTAWHINRKIYDVMEKVWEQGGGEEWKLPYREDRPSAQYEENFKNKSKRAGLDKKLQIAGEYLDEPRIYFPHTFDFRGRMYPLPLFVNPIGDDTGRALLEFADGKPINTPEAEKWFKIYGANCYGRDKDSIADRVKWVEEHKEMILAIADDPYNNREWLKADDKSVWKFLAFCFDYAAWENDRENHLSRLPIAMDGKCNGLQHYSALLRDEAGGRAVCLTVSNENDTPVDIYQEVANRVSDKVIADAKAGEKYAQIWLEEGGESKVSRAIVKKPVMNYPYGVTKWTVFQEIWKAAQESKVIDPDLLKEDETFSDAVSYLREKVWETIPELVTSAKRVMDWLKAIAALPNHFNYHGWVSPIGFHVNNMYYEDVDCPPVTVTPLGGTRMQIKIKERTFSIDYRQMKQSLPPNFIHSLDASHLMLTVLKCKEAGIDSFGMVHDSYATHAFHAPRMAQLLRAAFLEIYSEDVLDDFREQIKGGLDLVEEVSEGGELNWDSNTTFYSVTPHCVEMDSEGKEEYLQEIEKDYPLIRGNLDITEVLRSAYFFA